MTDPLAPDAGGPTPEGDPAVGATPRRERLFAADRLVFGVLAVATVIAAESTSQETFVDLLGAALVTMFLYWVTHAYTHQWGMRVRQVGGWGSDQFVQSLVHESPILVGAGVPTVALVVAWAAGASAGVAVTVVLWVSGVELVALEVVAAFRHRLSGANLAGRTVVSIATGLAILALRVLLH